jgi:hypothetical protein
MSFQSNKTKILEFAYFKDQTFFQNFSSKNSSFGDSNVGRRRWV